MQTRYLICPTDQTQITQAGDFSDLNKMVCPKCGGAMEVSESAKQPTSEFSFITAEDLQARLREAAPLAAELLQRTAPTGQWGIEVPMAHALALVAICKSVKRAGWKPDQILRMVMEVTG